MKEIKKIERAIRALEHVQELPPHLQRELNFLKEKLIALLDRAEVEALSA